MKYRVRLTREVCDLLVAHVEVEADSAAAAETAALSEAAKVDLDWYLDVCDPDPDDPEVSDVVLIPEKV